MRSLSNFLRSSGTRSLDPKLFSGSRRSSLPRSVFKSLVSASHLLCQKKNDLYTESSPVSQPCFDPHRYRPRFLDRNLYYGLLIALLITYTSATQAQIESDSGKSPESSTPPSETAPAPQPIDPADNAEENPSPPALQDEATQEKPASNSEPPSFDTPSQDVPSAVDPATAESKAPSTTVTSTAPSVASTHEDSKAKTTETQIVGSQEKSQKTQESSNKDPNNTSPIENKTDKKDATEEEVPEFLKGELIYPGTVRMLSRFDHVGVSIGPHLIDNALFLGVDPGGAYYMDNGLAMSFHLPLRFSLLEMASVDDIKFGGFLIRKEDWDEVSDFAQVIRFFTYGRKEAKLYFTINTMRPSTIGHGAIMSHYQPNSDVDRSMTGVMFDAYNDYAGFQFQANDVTFSNKVIGGLAFIKPLSFFNEDVYSKSVSLGLEYITDIEAPRCVRLDADSDQCVQGQGHQAGRNPYTGATMDNTFARTDPDTGRFALKESQVHALGTSIEGKFLKEESDRHNIDLKGYGTFHGYLNDGGGEGGALGVLARLNFGNGWINAFRIRTEYIAFGDGFIPGYFDAIYEIEKYQFPALKSDSQVRPTKYQAIFGDPDNGFERPELGTRHGYRLELSHGLFKSKRSAKKIAWGFGLQDATGPRDAKFFLHVEFPYLGWLQLFCTYMRNSENNLGGIFSKGIFTGRSSMLLSGFRLKVLPVLFINAHYSRSYAIVSTPGSEYHLGTDNIVDFRGEPSPYFTADTLYENVQTLFVELEFGWEFRDEE